MSKNTGGPAFPGSYTGNNGMPVWSDGMALRDYFAAKAMIFHLSKQMQPLEDYNYRNAATQAYRMADAMITARTEEGKV